MVHMNQKQNNSLSFALVSKEMPKEGKSGKKTLLKSHNPLDSDIRKPSGKLKAPKARNDDDDDFDLNAEEDNLPKNLKQKIVDQARNQREELINDDQNNYTFYDENEDDAFIEDFDEDDDENAEDLVNVEGDYVEGINLTAEEEDVVSKFLNVNKSQSRTLADIIMEKIHQKEENNRLQGIQMQEDVQYDNALPPKVVEVYTSVGKLLAHYTSGKLPKALKMLPHLKNWEDVLWITRPDEWSPIATYACTRIFASNLNAKMAQRFFNIVLLEKVRDDISRHNKLNYHLYLALKKALFKPAAFYKGLLLPLAMSNTCTLREATIIGLYIYLYLTNVYKCIYINYICVCV